MRSKKICAILLAVGVAAGAGGVATVAGAAVASSGTPSTNLATIYKCAPGVYTDDLEFCETGRRGWF